MENFVIVCEVSAADAHMALHEEVFYKFKDPSMKANANKSFLPTVSDKNLQDRFEKLLCDFIRCDAIARIRLGVRGELG